MNESTPLDLSKYPIKRMKPSDLIPHINPRLVLNHMTLLPAILAEEGQITEALTAWVPDEGDPIRKLVELKKGQAIPVKGHRRRECLLEIINNPSKYSATIVANASTCPVVLLTGISEDKARNLAMDFMDQEKLSRTDFLTDVFRRFECGHNYAKVAMELTKGLYLTLLQQATEGKYKAMLRIDDGAEREKQVKKDLRNPLDQWIFSAHLLGPAVKQNVLAWLKKQDRIALDEGERVLFKADQQNLKVLRSLYSNTTKVDIGNGKTTLGYTPITKISRTEEGVPVVVGGTVGGKVVDGVLTDAIDTSIADGVRKLMADYHLSPSEKAKGKAVLPKAVDRNNAKDGSISECGKLYSAFFCGMPAEGRMLADERANAREKCEAVRTEIYPEMGPLVQALINAENKAKDMNAIKMAFSEVDKAVRHRSELEDTIVKLTKEISTFKAPKKGK